MGQLSHDAVEAPLTTSVALSALSAHHDAIKGRDLRALFAEDPQRAERFTAQGAGLVLDFSKNRITAETLALLVGLAEARHLAEKRAAMFRGDKINVTEHRAVLHTALRAPRDAVIEVDGKNVVPQVHAVLDRMADFATRVRSGAWKGHTGKRIRNVVNIGIGGSHLGPEMAYLALRAFSDRDMRFRFVANVDGAAFTEATQDLDAEETLFVISSKTFTTLETMSNADIARAWLLQRLGEEYQQPLIVTGTVLFTTQDRSSSILRNNETRDQFGRRQTDTQRVYVESKAFILRPHFIFIDGRTGNVIYQRTFKEENQSGVNQQTPPLSSYFDLMDRLIPTFLSTLSSQKVKGTRFLLQ